MGTRKSKPAITINDVAQAAGVSRATASRVLGRYGAVSPEAATAVRAAAAEVGYQVNTVARSMITGRTQTVAFILPDIQNYFFVRVLRGMSDVARERGYDVLLANTDEDAELERQAVGLMRGRQVDGLLLCPAADADPSFIQNLVLAGEHIVLVDRPSAQVAVPSVGIDNRAGAYHATRVLLDAGHTRIGFVSGIDKASVERALASARAGAAAEEAPTEGRAVGYFTALLDAGIEPDFQIVVATDLDPSAVQAAVAELLASDVLITALLTTDSIVTLGALRGIQVVGWAVPDDISLVGFDDADWISVVDPPITVLEQPAYEIGAVAAGLLFDQIEGEDVGTGAIALPTVLIERESVGPPRTSARD